MRFTLPPKYIYKYRNFDYGYDLIKDCILYFNSPTNFEDFQDCNPDIIDFSACNNDIRKFINSTSKKPKYYKRELILEYTNDKRKFSRLIKQTITDELIKNTRVTCFSKFPNIASMWEKYADNNKGICIRFNSRINIDPILMHEVKYLESIPRINYFRQKEELMHNYFLIKLKQKYEYEREVRMYHNLGINMIKI